MREPIIVARGLGRAWAGTVVLRSVDVDVRAGEVLGLIGPNGGGKSTLLLLMAGLVRPTAGTVEVAGVPAHELPYARTGQVGLITAQPGLYPLLTGTENLHFFGGLFGLERSEVDRRAAPLLGELGLAAAMGRRVGGWSSGMMQKLSLVRALLLDPAVLLLDEPTANLDALAAHALYGAVRQRADAGMAVVVATHDLHAAEDLCDRVAVVHRTVEIHVPGPRPARAPSPLLHLLRGQDVKGEGDDNPPEGR